MKYIVFFDVQKESVKKICEIDGRTRKIILAILCLSLFSLSDARANVPRPLSPKEKEFCTLVTKSNHFYVHRVKLLTEHEAFSRIDLGKWTFPTSQIAEKIIQEKLRAFFMNRNTRDIEVFFSPPHLSEIDEDNWIEIKYYFDYKKLTINKENALIGSLAVDVDIYKTYKSIPDLLMSQTLNPESFLVIDELDNFTPIQRQNKLDHQLSDAILEPMIEIDNISSSFNQSIDNIILDLKKLLCL